MYEVLFVRRFDDVTLIGVIYNADSIAAHEGLSRIAGARE